MCNDVDIESLQLKVFCLPLCVCDGANSLPFWEKKTRWSYKWILDEVDAEMLVKTFKYMSESYNTKLEAV